ncbi:MAG: CZB domain-containing protein [Sideroxydans sp.]|jgi:hypothetical protein
MGFISALRSVFGISDEAREEVRREINFYEAVEAHLAWKLRLTDYLQGRSKEDLQPHNICVDNRCVLGKWIHGPGKTRFGEIKLFQELTDEHAKFHYYASKVVEAHQGGNTQLAEKMLIEDFAHQSKKTVNCLTKLHMQVEGKDTQ